MRIIIVLGLLVSAATAAADSNVVVTPVYKGDGRYPTAGSTHRSALQWRSADPGGERFVASYVANNDQLWEVELASRAGVNPLASAIGVGIHTLIDQRARRVRPGGAGSCVGGGAGCGWLVWHTDDARVSWGSFGRGIPRAAGQVAGRWGAGAMAEVSRGQPGCSAATCERFLLVWVAPSQKQVLAQLVDPATGLRLGQPRVLRDLSATTGDLCPHPNLFIEHTEAVWNPVVDRWLVVWSEWPAGDGMSFVGSVALDFNLGASGRAANYVGGCSNVVSSGCDATPLAPRSARSRVRLGGSCHAHYLASFADDAFLDTYVDRFYLDPTTGARRGSATLGGGDSMPVVGTNTWGRIGPECEHFTMLTLRPGFTDILATFQNQRSWNAAASPLEWKIAGGLSGWFGAQEVAAGVNRFMALYTDSAGRLLAADANMHDLRCPHLW